MPVNKNAQFRYQILDRCFSDFSHKYDFDTLLEKVNDHLKDVQGGDSMIGVRQLRGDINAIRKMLPHGIYLDAKPYYDKKCYYRYSERDSLSLHHYKVEIETELGEKELLSITAVSGSDAEVQAETLVRKGILRLR